MKANKDNILQYMTNMEVACNVAVCQRNYENVSSEGEDELIRREIIGHSFKSTAKSELHMLKKGEDNPTKGCKMLP